MKTLHLKSRQTFIAGCILTLPALYLILISLLKYTSDEAYIHNLTWPLLQSVAVREGLGLNANLLILFGPVLAFLLNLFSVLDTDYQQGEENVVGQFSIRKSAWNLAVLFCSSLALFLLFACILGEKCRC